MSKTINTRIQHKIDTSANWAKATGFIPKKGELIIYQDEGKAPRIKIGTGADDDYVNNLPFVSDNVLIVTTSPVDGTYYTSHSASEIYQYAQKGYLVLLEMYTTHYWYLNNTLPNYTVFTALNDDLEYNRACIANNTLELYSDYLISQAYIDLIEEDLQGEINRLSDKLNQMPTIHSGTTVPDNNVGQPGDLYIMYAE